MDHAGDEHGAGPSSNAHYAPKQTANSLEKRRRNRQKLSCMECRRLKLKCDRVWPCSACRRRGCAELCPDKAAKPQGRSARMAQELNLLLSRLQHVEGALRDLGADDQIPPPLSLEFAGKASTAAAEGKEDDEKAQDDAEEHGMDDQDQSDEVGEVLAGGVGSLSIREDDGRTRFLGTSAGSAYYYKDEDESDDSELELPSPPSQVTRYPFIQLGNMYPKAQELERLRGFLPVKDDIDRLSSNYWNYLSFQFEPLEEQVYWNDYLPAAITPGNTNGPKLACVFIILSLGHLMDPRAPSTPNANAQHFFTLAITTLSAARFLSHNTLAGVQTLQLCANYLLNSHDFQEGGETYFPILGMALRMLVSMGLHRDGSQWGLSNPELDRRRTVFWELVTLERMQMPPGAEPYHKEKWQLGEFIVQVIDKAFPVKPPSYATILQLDADLRERFAQSPKHLRCGALPADAFVVKPKGVPVLPELGPSEGSLKFRMRQHTLDMIYAQVFFYLHLPALRQALALHPEEPLSSPWAASVAVASLETGVYMLAIAKSWVALHPVLCPRWWHIFFHAFAASVAQSSIVIKSPKSVLARHAWSQLELAIGVFEEAASGGAPVATFVPRLKTLRETALLSLQNAQSVPMGLQPHQVASFLAEETDANLSILGPTTRLDRKSRKKGTDEARSSQSPGRLDGANMAASLDALYTPFDSPVLHHAQAGSRSGAEYDPAAASGVPFGGPAGLTPTGGPSSLGSVPQPEHMFYLPEHHLRSPLSQAVLPGQAPPPRPGPLSVPQEPAPPPPPSPPPPPASFAFGDHLGFTTFATGGVGPSVQGGGGSMSPMPPNLGGPEFPAAAAWSFWPGSAAVGDGVLPGNINNVDAGALVSGHAQNGNAYYWNQFQYDPTESFSGVGQLRGGLVHRQEGHEQVPQRRESNDAGSRAMNGE